VVGHKPVGQNPVAQQESKNLVAHRQAAVGHRPGQKLHLVGYCHLVRYCQVVGNQAAGGNQAVGNQVTKVGNQAAATVVGNQAAAIQESNPVVGSQGAVKSRIATDTTAKAINVAIALSEGCGSSPGD